MSARKNKDGSQYGLIKVLRRNDDGSYECECQGCGKIYDIDNGNIGKRFMCRDCFYAGISNDLSGQRFGKLVAREKIIKINNKRRVSWLCDCDCGKQIIVREDSLMSGRTRSCGCIRKEIGISDELRKHFVDGTCIDKIQGKPTKANKTGVVGVNWDKSRNLWQASIRFQGRKIFLGRYVKFEDAVEARKKGEELYFSDVLKSNGIV